MVHHDAEHQTYITTSYGPAPQRVLVVDGCFIALMNKGLEAFRSGALKFNEKFKFDFYDVALCMDAYKLRDGNPNFKVYLYETAPVRKITGFFCWGGVTLFDARFMHDGFPPATYGCVNVEDLKKYQGENCAICGWFIDLPQKFNEPKSLEDFGLERPPQSWCYTEVEA